MANKKYNDYDPGVYDTNKIFLQADPETGALEKVNLPTTAQKKSTVMEFNRGTSEDPTVRILRDDFNVGLDYIDFTAFSVTAYFINPPTDDMTKIMVNTQCAFMRDSIFVSSFLYPDSFYVEVKWNPDPPIKETEWTIIITLLEL